MTPNDGALFPVEDAWSGDPIHPDLDHVTPPQIVALLSPADRRRRVSALINQADAILADALDTHTGGKTIAATCLLWSGGNDSNTLAHLMRRHVTHVVHANTGIGIEATRQHVRDTAAAWGLPLIEKHPPEGDRYRDWVVTDGFPGPGHHFKAFQRLKERALREARNELIGRAMSKRVVFLAGRRREESRRRSGEATQPPVPAHERVGRVIWVSPIVMWTKLDLNTYRQMHPDVPHNPVTDHLHMSGECLCGAFAGEDEREQIRDWYPEVVAEIEALEAEARANGVREPLCRWGWGADPELRRTERAGRPSATGPLCNSCAIPGLLDGAA
jgi:3'-phosphoadenosine 5'-phosphosulfate sulfotransferase (PAPS reductase)/FAD synthetase